MRYRNISDENTDIVKTSDRGEDIAVMEPLQVSDSSRHQANLTELAVDLAAKSAGYRRSLPDGVVSAVVTLTVWVAAAKPH